MENYEQKINDLLGNGSPREKYENLIQLFECKKKLDILQEQSFNNNIG